LTEAGRLAILAGAVVALALALAPRSEAFVYWANVNVNKGIGRANLDGSSVNQSFIGTGNAPCGVAVDSGHV
jgi:hypothetical protein